MMEIAIVVAAIAIGSGIALLAGGMVGIGELCSWKGGRRYRTSA